MGKRYAVRIAWIVAMSLTVCGYVAILAPARAEVRAVEMRQLALRQRETRYQRLLDAEPRVLTLREAVRQRILRSVKSEGVATASLVRVLAMASARYGVRITLVAPRAGPRAASASPPSLNANGVTIIVSGTFASMLSLLEGFAASDELVGVDSVQFDTGSIANARGAPMLEATIEAQVFSLTNGWEAKIGEGSGAGR